MIGSRALTSNQFGIVLALAAASFYGCVPNFARAAFGQGVPALETVLMRTSFITIVLGVVAITGGESFSLPRSAWRSFAAQAAATFIVSVSYLASIQFIPVGLAVIIFFAFPVIIIVVAPIVEGKSPSLTRLAIALLAFVGLGLAVGPGFETLDWRGVLLASASAIGCALQFFSGRALSRHLKPLVFGSLVHFAIWPVVLFVVIYSGGMQLRLFTADLSGMAYLFVGGVCLAYVAGYFLHMSSLQAAPASVVAPYFNLEPIITTVVSTAMLGETLKLNQYGGGAIVLAALLLAGLVGKQEDEA